MITLALTSCGRLDLLERTIDSFLKFNTAKIEQYIISEDDLAANLDPLKKKYSHLPFVWLQNPSCQKMGMLRNIDHLYSHITTEFVFHCEDDWEFYREGFIEESLCILDYGPEILQVWLREQNDTNGHPIEKEVLTSERMFKVNFNLVSKGYLGCFSGYSTNPGLRRLKDKVCFEALNKLGPPNIGPEGKVSMYYDSPDSGPRSQKKGMLNTSAKAEQQCKKIMPSSTGIWSQEEANTGHLFSYRIAQYIGNLLRNNKNFLVWDMGCGKGAYVRYLLDIGFRYVNGIEGTPLQDFEVPAMNVLVRDLAKDKLTVTDGEEGHVICLEVAEHIPAEFQENFLDNVCRKVMSGGYLILSWAVPGQDGLGHVNCKTNEEVEELIEARGFEVSVHHSIKIR